MASAYVSIFTRHASARTPFGVPGPLFHQPARSVAKQLRAYHQPAWARRPATPAKSLYGARLGAFGTVAVGLGLSVYAGSRTVYCDPAGKTASTSPAPAAPPKGAKLDAEPLPPPPASSVNMYELSFGTVCGICAGVFIKKGAKAVAFALGGVFVLLQYLGSKSIVRVDWTRVSRKFENLFYTTDKETGKRRAPTVVSLWRWLVDFLTADFQPRASFVAGLALGIRIG